MHTLTLPDGLYFFKNTHRRRDTLIYLTPHPFYTCPICKADILGSGNVRGCRPIKGYDKVARIVSRGKHLLPLSITKGVDIAPTLFRNICRSIYAPSGKSKANKDEHIELGPGVKRGRTSAETKAEKNQEKKKHKNL